MSNGIYCYKDTYNNDKVVYVGKDSHIDRNRRHNAHHQPSRYNAQVINRVLQNNPNRYIYHVLKEGDFDESLLNALEIIYTRRYNPKFSYTIGGDGSRGYKHTEEAKKKLSETNKGRPSYMKGKKHSRTTLVKMSKIKNTTGYFRVTKQNNPKCSQGFVWAYNFYKENGKRKSLVSVDINKLKEKVLANGLEWIEIAKEE